MKPTDFSRSLTDYLTRYLPEERGSSHNTILAYKDTFLLFITFMQETEKVKADRLDFKMITRDRIVAYLDWLQGQRHCSSSTRNARLACFHSFFRYLQYQLPAGLYDWQQIMSIPLKRTEKQSMNYLSLDGIRSLLASPDVKEKRGRRDLALLSLMYDTGARVQEIIDLTPAMIRLDKPCTIKLIGKGNKARIVPLLDAQVELLHRYMSEYRLTEPFANQYPLFFNSRKEKLTRSGVTYILK